MHSSVVQKRPHPMERDEEMLHRNNSPPVIDVHSNKRAHAEVSPLSINSSSNSSSHSDLMLRQMPKDVATDIRVRKEHLLAGAPRNAPTTTMEPPPTTKARK